MDNRINQLMKQCRKPSGLYGRLVAFRMNRSHSQLTDWGLNHMQFNQEDILLDVGCGGGRTIEKLAAIASSGKVYGLDYSQDSLAVAAGKNKKFIKNGRVELKQGVVSQMPYSDGMFDKVTAVETYYFWPDIVKDLQEVLRVLKPGGALAIICEIYKDGKHDERNRVWVEAGKMNYHTPEELAALFEQAGYESVQAFKEYEKGWMCVVGSKPA